jgi:cupin 2 domain-containing protein
MPDSDNLYDLPPAPWQDEIFEILHANDGVRIERILSCGHTTPAGEFYDQNDDEWVVLIQGEAEISFDDGSTRRLTPGDHLLIGAHQRHRVTHTSTEPPCIWLAVHIVKGS